MSSMKYNEKQKLHDRLAYVFLSLWIILSATGLFFFLFQEGGPYYGRAAASLVIITILAFTLHYLRSLRLKVSINDRRIKYKLKPLHKHSRRIEWDDVETCELVQTPLCSRWHGSNIHFLNEVMYSLCGRNGLSITTHDGRKYFIGIKNVNKLKGKLQDLEV